MWSFASPVGHIRAKPPETCTRVSTSNDGHLWTLFFRKGSPSIVTGSCISVVKGNPQSGPNRLVDCELASVHSYDWKLGGLVPATSATDSHPAYLESTASLFLDGGNSIPDKFSDTRDAVVEYATPASWLRPAMPSICCVCSRAKRTCGRNGVLCPAFTFLSTASKYIWIAGHAPVSCRLVRLLKKLWSANPSPQKPDHFPQSGVS